MTTSHIFFIPMMLLIGAVLGWIQGRKALLAEQAEQEAAQQRKAARRLAREPKDQRSAADEMAKMEAIQ